MAEKSSKEADTTVGDQDEKETDEMSQMMLEMDMERREMVFSEGEAEGSIASELQAAGSSMATDIEKLKMGVTTTVAEQTSSASKLQSEATAAEESEDYIVDYLDLSKPVKYKSFIPGIRDKPEAQKDFFQRKDTVHAD